jgi:alpha-tubulin suppressor-like RCC1 family protein
LRAVIVGLHLFVALMLTSCLGKAPEEETTKYDSNLPPLTITPQNPQVQQGQTRRFNGQGGYIGKTGAYSYSLIGLGGQTPPGSIDSITGVYTAPATVNPNNSVAFVVVKDDLDATAITTILTVVNMKITPTTNYVTVGKVTTFAVIGGQAPFNWCAVDTVLGTCLANSNIGSFDANGVFTAKTIAGTGTVMVTDASNNTASGVIVINPVPQLQPNGISIPYGWMMQMLTTGGTSPFSFAVDTVSAASGASVSSSGLFIAPNTTGAARVTVSDYYAYTSTVNLSVIAPNTMASGDDFNCLLFPDTQGVKCWGNSAAGQTGYAASIVSQAGIGNANSILGDDVNEVGVRVPLHSLNNGGYIGANQVVAGAQHACILDGALNIRCWGKNNAGVFGTTAVTAVDAVLANADAGSNAGAQAAKFTNNASAPAAYKNVAIYASLVASGAKHLCAIEAKNVLTSTDVFCWGENSSAQLAFGNTTTPQTQPDYLKRLHFPTKVLDLQAGSGHTCVLLKGTDSSGANVLPRGANQIRCWGDNTKGQLGIGTTGGNFGGAAGDPAKIVANDGTEKPVSFTAPGPLLERLFSGKPLMPVALTTGAKHTCALLNDNTVRCWGDNTYGQLGLGSTTALLNAPSSASIAFNTLLTGIDPTRTQSVIKIRAGYNKTCALLLGGDGKLSSLQCVGDNASGSLGVGIATGIAGRDAIGTDPLDMGSGLLSVDVGSGVYVTDLSIGKNFVCAILNDNRVKCWGNNASGQLGNNSSANYGSSNFMMGDYLPTVGFF